ncbi:MAG TPA: hypothetical protein DGR97_01575 [Gammaproteobacteria bacterium]|nr:hypothetical protein [Gammaproteobacteria bacterium]|tara:strand:- start:754 stop:1509 length:756 start_codon:yes stop_codon:yes gene_type:complete
MKTSTWILISLSLVPFSPARAADSAYVIDKLLVGVHQDQDLSSSIIKVLPTGTKLGVIKREGELALIKDPEGTLGWVDAAYLMEEVPASLRVKSLIDENTALNAKLNATVGSTKDANLPTVDERDELTKENTELKRKLSSEKLKSEKLQTQIGALESDIAKRTARLADTRMADLEAENKSLVRNLEVALQEKQKLRLRPERKSAILNPVIIIKPYSWPILIAIGVALLLAFGAGAYFIDYLGRRRHGGFRI